MPITTTWLTDDHRVIRWVFSGAWTIAEYETVHQRIVTEVDDVGAPTIDTIVVQDGSHYTPSGGVLSAMRGTFDNMRCPVSDVYVAGASPVQRRFFTVITCMYRTFRPQVAVEIHWVNSEAEAIQQIETRRGITLASGRLQPVPVG